MEMRERVCVEWNVDQNEKEKKGKRKKKKKRKGDPVVAAHSYPAR
jgi:hypothetical protein